MAYFITKMKSFSKTIVMELDEWQFYQDETAIPGMKQRKACDLNINKLYKL